VRHVLSIPLLIVLALVVGCERDDEIRSYQAPKETAPPALAQAQGQPGQMPQGQIPVPPAPAADESPTFTVPPGWKDLGAQSMRFAQFQVSEDDPTALATVVPLGRESGDLLSNVNRWEGQVGAPASKAEDLPKVARQIDVNGVPATVVDISGEKVRTIAAIVSRGERVWFFKLTGSVNTVGAQAKNFDAFVQSIRFGAQVAKPAAPEAGGPAGANVEPKWELPEGWVKQPDKPMRFATFRTSADANAPEVIVSSFGAFGTMLDNINRWRGMVGLEPINDEKQQPVERIKLAGQDGALFDMSGPAKDGQPPRRLMIAMVPAGESVWFFRMSGPAEAVETQKSNFDALLKSVKFE
jgi:hypothetical protein